MSFFLVAGYLAACHSDLVITKSSEASKIQRLSLLESGENGEVHFYGSFLTSDLKIDIEGNDVAYKLVDANEGVFLMPKLSVAGLTKVTFMRAESAMASLPIIYVDGATAQSSFLSADAICDDTLFRDQDGEVQKGKRQCGSELKACTKAGELGCVTNAELLPVKRSNLSAKVLKSLSVAGVEGTKSFREDPCAQNLQVACAANTTFPAAEIGRLLPENVRVDTTLLGVAGRYPSASYPLSKNTSLIDLNSGNFESRLRSALSFEWFDRNGQKYVAAGESNLKTEFIKSGVTIFGVQGSMGSSVLPVPSITISNVNADSIEIGGSVACCLAEGFIIVASESTISFVPSSGTSYAQGDVVDAGGAVVIYKGGDSSNIVYGGLSANKRYNLMAWSYREGPVSYSTDAFSTYAKTSFTVSFGGNSWTGFSKLSSGLSTVFPYYDSSANSIVMTASNIQSQANFIFSNTKRTLPMTVAFDYMVSSNGADGFALVFGKNFDEYYQNIETIQTGRDLGFVQGSGYVVTFNTHYGSNDINKVMLRTLQLPIDYNILQAVDFPLEDKINQYKSVEITIESKRVVVYVDGTKVIDYSASVEWDMTYPYIGFTSTTGSSYTKHQIANIEITNP